MKELVIDTEVRLNRLQVEIIDYNTTDQEGM